jgi:hypothetical protein
MPGWRNWVRNGVDTIQINSFPQKNGALAPLITQWGYRFWGLILVDETVLEFSDTG